MRIYFYLFLSFIFSSCANIVTPNGGRIDMEPPICIEKYKKIKLNSNKESTLTYVFNENIREHKFIGNFHISPPINKTSYTISENILEISIKDSINANLNYEVNLGNCIKDITEGNILKKFNDKITNLDSIESKINISKLQIVLKNSLDNTYEKDHWVLLYKSTIPDSLIFKITPNYVSKSTDGYFFLNNIVNGKYKIVSLSGDDYIYNENEIISFSNKLITTSIDTMITLYSFNPLHKLDTMKIIKDTMISDGGNLTLKSNLSGNIIVQLTKGDKVFLEKKFENTSYFNLQNIETGEYHIRAFLDNNTNGYWDSGSYYEMKQPEKMYHFNEIITIRSNWDLEIEWIIEE